MRTWDRIYADVQVLHHSQGCVCVVTLVNFSRTSFVIQLQDCAVRDVGPYWEGVVMPSTESSHDKS